MLRPKYSPPTLQDLSLQLLDFGIASFIVEEKGQTSHRPESYADAPDPERESPTPRSRGTASPLLRSYRGRRGTALPHRKIASQPRRSRRR